MLEVRNIMLSLNSDEKEYVSALSNVLGVPSSDILSFSIKKKSIDARKGIRYVMSFLVAVRDESRVAFGPSVSVYEEKEKYALPTRTQSKTPKVIIVGAGPCGLFAALYLTRAGAKTVIYERGKTVDERSRDVESLFNTGELNEESNVQFGEGGAGTFSDGKLNTGVNDKRIEFVMKSFVQAGAPEEILYDAKPHIGTDKLKTVVKNLREDIIEHGGEFVFSAKMTDLLLDKTGRVCGIKYVKNNETFEDTADAVLLAVGHSARDTYESLEKSGVFIEPKAFSVGVRIEHKRKDINKSLYRNENLTASYKLSHRLTSGRGVYTFCMCPGGVVVCGSSEKNGIATNGMSEYARNAENSNSAVLVGVTPDDFPQGKLGGVEFQRKIERAAFNVSGTYKAPCQRYGDLIKGKASVDCGRITPSYRPGVVYSDLRECLPAFAIDGIKEGIRDFGRKIEGFDCADALLTGVETRSSSPIRLTRKDNGESLLNERLFPAGEGAGYSGGITSSAVDGLVTAEKIIALLSETVG